MEGQNRPLYPFPGASGRQQEPLCEYRQCAAWRLQHRFHSHSQQEEFFLVLEGCGTLHLNDDCIPVKAGDFFAKPAGEGIAHTFYNSGEKPLVLLDVGTVEKEDTCIYPRDNMLMHKSNGITRVFRLDSEEHTWTSEPNEEVVDENGCTTDSLQVLNELAVSGLPMISWQQDRQGINRQDLGKMVIYASALLLPEIV